MKLKDAFYFSHDSNAKDDPKCVMLIEQLGLEGYGIYWVLIETLRDQPDYKYPLVLLSALARRYNTTIEKIKIVVLNYGLFTIENDEFFLSKSLCQRMQLYENKREKNRLAGIQSGKIRALKSLPIESQSINSSIIIEPIDEIKQVKSIEKGNKFIPPTLEEVKQYFKDNGYIEDTAITCYNYYSVSDWKDRNGTKIKNWKQKVIAVWFKEEYKIKSEVNRIPSLGF